MNLIITENNDVTSDLIISWLLNLNIEIKRMNVENHSSFLFSIKKGNIEFNINGLTPKKILIRRGRFNFIDRSISLEKNLINYLFKEQDSIIKSIELFLTNDSCIGSYLMEVENYKLHQLEVAIVSGLKVPNTLATNCKIELKKFKKDNIKIITKDIRYPVRLNLNCGKFNSIGTFIVTDEMIKNLSSNFVPMIFQEYIEKEYELRIFFFKESFYPMAIFSQNNNNTKIDYRNYDELLPNRCVPVLLPFFLQIKLKKFIKLYGLNMGSIDIIKSKNGEYIFLEVNPQGQIDWLSKNCNYYIERDIAKYFKNNE